MKFQATSQLERIREGRSKAKLVPRRERASVGWSRRRRTRRRRAKLRRDLRPSSSPPSISLFDTPLFLSLYCSILRSSPRLLPSSLSLWLALCARGRMRCVYALYSRQEIYELYLRVRFNSGVELRIRVDQGCGPQLGILWLLHWRKASYILYAELWLLYYLLMRNSVWTTQQDGIRGAIIDLRHVPLK